MINFVKHYYNIYYIYNIFIILYYYKIELPANYVL